VRMMYRWGRALVCFLSRNEREGNTESAPSSASSSDTQWSLQRVRSLSWKGPIRAIGPLKARSKSRAAIHGNELQPPEEEGGDRIARERRNAPRQSNRQTRKSILTAKKRDNNIEGCHSSCSSQIRSYRVCSAGLCRGLCLEDCLSTAFSLSQTRC
jgi:hypothetical protein